MVGGARRARRSVERHLAPDMGTYCIARDGHMCNSLAEKTIDDFLSMHGVPARREPLYPDQIHRGDFLVLDFMIEYFGLRLRGLRRHN